jgi:tRNA threonylcarbamoyl adenosine modification protein YjeE
MTLDDLKRVSLSWLAPELLEPQPKLVLLNGPMGSGKTTFVAMVAKQLGAGDAASPSFALHSRYEGHRGTIDHFDLDRLKSLDELESIGFWDLIDEAKSDPRRFVMIEWATRLGEFGLDVNQISGFRVWKIAFQGQPNWTIAMES